MLIKHEELTISKTWLQYRWMNCETGKMDLLIVQKRLEKHCWKTDCIILFFTGTYIALPSFLSFIFIFSHKDNKATYCFSLGVSTEHLSTSLQSLSHERTHKSCNHHNTTCPHKQHCILTSFEASNWWWSS